MDLVVPPQEPIKVKPTPSEAVLTQLRGLGEPITSNIDNIAEDFSNFVETLGEDMVKQQAVVDTLFWVFASGATVPINPGSAFNVKFKVGPEPATSPIIAPTPEMMKGLKNQ